VKTNKECTVVRRKRAPGGGRKPRGEFSNKRAMLATRVTTETRKALDAAASISGLSLSQEVERRLRDSLIATDKADRDPATAALCHVITRSAETISLISERPWNGNRWCVEALKFAVTKFLDQVPTPESDQPGHLSNFTPELLGASLALGLFSSVEQADPDDDIAATYPERFRPIVRKAGYALSRVRRDLKIPFASRKKEPQQ
jgi:hypothetical protein